MWKVQVSEGLVINTIKYLPEYKRFPKDGDAVYNVCGGQPVTQVGSF